MTIFEGDAKLEIKKSGLDNPMKAPAPKELATEKIGVEPPKKKKKKESSYLDDLWSLPVVIIALFFYWFINDIF